MEGSAAIAWCGFVGAWLLVAGPIYQASIELADEEIERADVERMFSMVEPIPQPSRWWLLFPPAAYFLRQRRQRAFREAMVKVISRDELEALMHYGEKATAWLFVGGGAFLIAVKETWELHEIYEWPVAAFYAIIIVMVIVCAANTALRGKRRQGILEQAQG